VLKKNISITPWLRGGRVKKLRGGRVKKLRGGKVKKLRGGRVKKGIKKIFERWDQISFVRMNRNTIDSYGQKQG
jgi:hypothetical protein